MRRIRGHRVRWFAPAVAVAVVIAGAGPAVGGDGPALRWAACSDGELAGWQCATLTVPRDPKVPAAGTFDLAVAKLPATGRSIGSLLFNPGGPGASSIDQAQVIASLLPRSLRRNFDFVTWDVRGVGRSDPLRDCPPAAIALPPVGPVNWDAVLASAREAQRQANITCATHNAGAVPFLGTAANVRDVEALRQALGEQRVSFWAVSAGTRLAAAYAQAHPNHVRAFVLSGVVNPDGGITDWAQSTATGVDDALTMLFDVSPQTRQQADRVMATLASQPLHLPSGTTLTRWTVGLLATAIKSMNNGMPLVASLFSDLDAALHGSGDEQVQALARLDALPPLSADAIPLSDPTASIIQCLDYADRPTPRRQAALIRRAVAAAPIAGWLTVANLTQCAGISTPPDPVGPITMADQKVPLLLVNSTKDPNTPMVWADKMAAAVPSARVVRYSGTTHGPFLTVPSRCVDQVGVDFLLSGRLPARDRSCPFVNPFAPRG